MYAAPVPRGLPGPSSPARCARLVGRREPHSAAFINHDRGQTIDWRTFDATTTGLAVQLLRLGFRKGDFLAASLPFLTGHILLEYACFKIGVIHAPLDLRLRPAEVIRCLQADQGQGIRVPGTDAVG